MVHNLVDERYQQYRNKLANPTCTTRQAEPTASPAASVFLSMLEEELKVTPSPTAPLNGMETGRQSDTAMSTTENTENVKKTGKKRRKPAAKRARKPHFWV